MTNIVDDLAQFNGKWPYEQARLELVSLRNERDNLQDGVISRDMTIDGLRQRVKELEDYICNDVRDMMIELDTLKPLKGYKDAWIEAQRGRSAAERELAALKAGQGEWEDAVLGQHSITYTSTPSIPEGMKLVNSDGLMTVLALYIAHEHYGEVDELLSAAPKQGEKE